MLQPDLAYWLVVIAGLLFVKGVIELMLTTRAFSKVLTDTSASPVLVPEHPESCCRYTGSARHKFPENQPAC